MKGDLLGTSPGILPIMARGGRCLGDCGLPSYTISSVLQKVEARRAKVFSGSLLRSSLPHQVGGGMAGTLESEARE